LATAGVIPRPAHPYPDDERFPSGWFTWEECDLLAEWARGKLILELGTFLGRSTVAMARTAKRVVTVDHFSGSPLENWYEPGDYLPQTRDNLRRYGVERNVTVIATDTANLFGWIRERSFDGVLIDAAHDAASVLRDSGIAIAACRFLQGLLWDDYTPDWPDVLAYVDALGRETALAPTPLAPGSKLVRLA
jgi:Methyltransferase domain